MSSFIHKIRNKYLFIFFEGSLRHIYRFFEVTLSGHGSLKNPGWKGSVWNQKWCLKELLFEGSLRHLYRFFEVTIYGNGSLKNPGLKGSVWNQKWYLKEPF